MLLDRIVAESSRLVKEGLTALDGGGMSNGVSAPALTNCVLWGDTHPEIVNADGSAAIVTYCDVEGGYLYPGTGNINADPLFVDPGSGDLHLGPGSPCIDTGSNLAPNLPETNFEGDARIVDGDGDGDPVVDMGVDERRGPASTCRWC